VKGKSVSGKITSDVTVADELDSWTKTKQLLRPEDQLELSEQVQFYYLHVTTVVHWIYFNVGVIVISGLKYVEIYILVLHVFK
jgi:hypothetical protein